MHVDCYRFCAFDYMFMSIPCDSSRPSPLTLMDLTPLPLLLDATEGDFTEGSPLRPKPEIRSHTQNIREGRTFSKTLQL